MKEILKRGATSNILRVFLPDSTSTSGAGKTGLTNSSSGLIISTIADVEATATTYTSAASNVETITTLGTFAAPSSNKVRFREVDATNFPGLYEIQIANARFSVANTTALVVSVQCTGVAPTFAEIQLVAVDLYDSVRMGMTALPNAAAEASGGLITRGIGTGQISLSSGAVTVGTNNDKTGYSLATAPPTSADIADAVWDEALSGHLSSGSTGAALNAAGAAGDPWSTSIPGAYGAGTAGYILGTNIDAAISSRLASGNVTVGGFSAGAITSAAFGIGALTSNAFAAGAIAPGVLAATSITNTTFTNGAITAAVIATGAITADEISSNAAQEIANAVWTANITNDYSVGGNPSAAWANDTMGKRVLRSSSNTDATEGVVWDVDNRDHLTAHSTGKNLDQIRRANFVTPGEIDGTSTASVLNTNVTGYANNAFDQQSLVFITGSLAGESGVILTYNTDGTITMDQPFTGTPVSTNEFVILPTHVYPMSYIVSSILEGNTSTSAYAAGDVGNVLGRLVNMIAADGADFQFTANALELAPSGGGGGGGSTTVRMGPFVIKAEGQGSEEPLDINNGATHAIECQLVDAEGTGVDITGATLTAKVYNSAGTLVETVSGTISYAALGQVRWTIGTTTTNTPGTYTVTITRTTGASDTQIFGPLRVYVRDI